MDTGKNYVLSKEKGNKVLTKKFTEYKITGAGFLLCFLFLGFLVIFATFETSNYILHGILLIFIGAFIFVLLFPIELKVTEYKDKFLIQKTKSFWIKRKIQIPKKEKPKILGVQRIFLTITKNNRIYNPRISFSDKEIKLGSAYISAGSGMSNPDLNTEEEIKEIAKFFKLPYKFR